MAPGCQSPGLIDSAAAQHTPQLCFSKESPNPVHCTLMDMVTWLPYQPSINFQDQDFSLFSLFCFRLAFCEVHAIVCSALFGHPGKCCNLFTQNQTQGGDIRGHLRLFNFCLGLRDLGSNLAASAVCRREPWAALGRTSHAGHLWRSRPPSGSQAAMMLRKALRLLPECLASFKAGS